MPTRNEAVKYGDGSAVLYALPRVNAEWSATGIVLGDDSEQAGLYWFANLDAELDYGIRVRAGANPSESDDEIGVIWKAAEVDAIVSGVIAGLPQPILIASPVLVSGKTLTPIIRGADYKSAHGNSIAITVSSGATLTGSVVTLSGSKNGHTFTATGTAAAHESIEDRWIVTLEATRTQTNVPAGDYVAVLKATLSGGEVVPLGYQITVPIREGA